jgi:putative permease
MNVIKNWYQRFVEDPQLVLLALILILSLAVIILFGQMLAPVLAALILAFLLDGAVTRLKVRGVSNLAASTAVFLLFLMLSLIAFFALLPPIMGQFGQFFSLLPTMVTAIQEQVMRLPEAFPGIVDEAQIAEIVDHLRSEFIVLGQDALAFSLGGLANLLTIIVYLVLVPVMVFFFLKDKTMILAWFGHYLPENRQLAGEVWSEALAKAGDYARGKVYEILIVGTSAWIVYWALDLRFAAFLAVITGVSVLVPYIGAALVTFPVAFVALFQWGPGSEAVIAVVAYLILQALDGNVLVPLLFSEVVKIHPNAIILAVLLFGGIWGLWGVFFAIPLATLFNAVITAWSHHRRTNHGSASHDRSS